MKRHYSALFPKAVAWLATSLSQNHSFIQFVVGKKNPSLLPLRFSILANCMDLRSLVGYDLGNGKGHVVAQEKKIITNDNCQCR
jgi:hypothetical protein